MKAKVSIPTNNQPETQKRWHTWTLPGFEGFPVYVILGDIVKGNRDLRLFERAAAISFNMLMAIPPTLIFLASLVPFLPLNNTEPAIIDAIKLLSPNEKIFENVSAIVTDFLHTKRRDLLSIGILFTIFYSSNGLMGLMRAFDRVSDATKFRTGVNRRLNAIWLTIILMLLSLMIVAFLIFQSNMLAYFFQSFEHNSTLVTIISRLSMLIIMFLMICLIYKFCPSLHERSKFFSPGAWFATVMSMLVSYVFVYFATNIIHYNKVYGSLGSLLMFLAWLSISSVIIILGFELNIAIYLRKRSLKKAPQQ
ncbi:hypothetical protein DBR32_05670 [Taibaiella sp. KBW10]|uniref:YihY/virulence factor BrkB family protein n=1 Tax=Taibaiella sp. KBW10 TaxID=2153357 RepID=UPI000F5B80E5|nr:YihY/virulence factor BrkB family protein [Taibaiella sp. KBW10]RQO31450.1 hypothetical protein DBR32_05670 [Taibaiella sp. KBW10]